MALLLVAGSFILPPPHPNILFAPEHPAHRSSRYIEIPDGRQAVPALLLTPPQPTTEAVLVVHGAGDTKISFKWRLMQTLLAEGLTVLTIDLPGHGDNRRQPLVYPDCLSAIPAAIQFLRAQPGIKQVGLLGISLGGAMAIKALADQPPTNPIRVEALVVLATPIRLNYSNGLFYREMWTTCYRAPLLSLLRETTVKQLRESWYSGGYRSRHNTAELFELMQPLQHIAALKETPILLVYSRDDRVAPPHQAQAMRRAVPQADFIEARKASHVSLVLMPEINLQIARWFRKQFNQDTQSSPL
jgi:pimeloyl-ACP methyl ester carboxylesterase